MNTIIELSPIYDSRKSFYGKAHVIIDRDNDIYTLRSYDTDVCRVRYLNSGFVFEKLWDGYSATTMRHINDFVYQYCDRNYGGGKKWWDSLKVGVA